MVKKKADNRLMWIAGIGIIAVAAVILVFSKGQIGTGKAITTETGASLPVLLFPNTHAWQIGKFGIGRTGDDAVMVNTAFYADNAGLARRAVVAELATTADHAKQADSAQRADRAKVADVANRISGCRRVTGTVTESADRLTIATVSCKLNEIAVGGGGFCKGNAGLLATLAGSYPQNLQTWMVACVPVQPATQASAEPFAICCPI